MKILNLTQHEATATQIEAGVMDVTPEDKLKLLSLLNFDVIPTRLDISKRANAIAEIAMNYDCPKAMIGGALWLMPELESALVTCPDCIQPIYAFSVRESVEVHNADGTVSKKVVFKHAGFVE